MGVEAVHACRRALLPVHTSPGCAAVTLTDAEYRQALALFRNGLIADLSSICPRCDAGRHYFSATASNRARTVPVASRRSRWLPRMRYRATCASASRNRFSWSMPSGRAIMVDAMRPTCSR